MPDRLTSSHGSSLQLGGGDVLRIDTPCATIPPSLLARSVVIPTCWGRHFYTSIDELYRCDRSTVITHQERRDSISFSPSNNLDFCLLPRTEVARFIDLTVISPSFSELLEKNPSIPATHSIATPNPRLPGSGTYFLHED